MTCDPCQQYRKEMGAAMSQGAFIKAAMVAMEGMAHMTGVSKLKRPIGMDDATWQQMLEDRKKEAERRMDEHDATTE